MEWISVKEQRPNHYQFCVVSGGDIEGVTVGQYDPFYGESCFLCLDIDAGIDDSDAASLSSATHWMPLPPIPQGE